MLPSSEKAAAEAYLAEQRHELDLLQQRVMHLEISIRACEEFLSHLDGVTASPASAILRPRSQVERAYRVLEAAGTPVHVGEILNRMGDGDTAAARRSLVGSLSRYVRQEQIFSRPARGTFGLLAWETGEVVGKGSEDAHGEPEDNAVN